MDTAALSSRKDIRQRVDGCKFREGSKYASTHVIGIDARGPSELKKSVCFVSNVGTSEDLEAHLWCFVITKGSVVHALSVSLPHFVIPKSPDRLLLWQRALIARWHLPPNSLIVPSLTACAPESSVGGRESLCWARDPPPTTTCPGTHTHTHTHTWRDAASP